MNTKRIIWLDILKTIAIYAVIFYHLGKFTFSFSEGIHAYISYFLRSILCIGVPLFFTVNGALMLSSNKPFDIKKHCKKIIHILVITFLWGVIVKAILLSLSDTFFTIKDLLLGSWNGDGLNYLWFMKSLLTIYVLFPLIQAAFQNEKYINIFCFISLLGILTFGNTFILRLVNSVHYLIRGNIYAEKFNFLNGFNDFQRFNAYPIVYFILGGILIRNIDKLKCVSRKIYATFIIFSMLVMTFYGIILSKTLDTAYNIAGNSYSSIMTMTIVICLFGLCSKLNAKNKYVQFMLSEIGKNTMGIYFLHIPIGYILSHYFTYLSAHQKTEWYKIIFSLIVMFLSLLITCIFRKIPLLNRMFHM